jgi:acyl-CoA synthetase (AMP-forming)/AMP-acid ligase II
VTQHERKNPSSVIRWFSSTFAATDGQLGDRCEIHVVSSPFPPIPIKEYDPLPEFIMSGWKGSGGHLGDQVAVIDGSTGMQRTFHDYYNYTCGLAGSLRYDVGVQEKDCVCLFAPNHVDYLPVTVAVGLCGAKVTPVNPLYKKNELKVILDRSRSTVLIAHISTLNVAMEAARDSKYVKHVFVMTEDGQVSPVEGVETLDGIKSHSQAFNTTVRNLHPHPGHHPYLLPYSSGTTGLPKGVCLTHSNMVANLLQIEEVEYMAFGLGEKLISPLPFFHIYGLVVSCLYAAWKGHPVITMSGRFDFELFLELVKEHRPERAHLVPPIILGLAKNPLADNYDFSSIKCIVSAAAPLGLAIEDAVKDRLGCQVKQAWGMSELSPIATMNSDFSTKPSSVGPLVSSTYGKIVDENGKSLGPNQNGELCIKGPQVMMVRFLLVVIA